MSTEINSMRETITPRTQKWIRISAVLAMLIVAVSSAILSFDGLQKIALESQVPAHLAFLFPIAVDTTILMGSLAVLMYEMVGVRSVFGWFTVFFGTVLSVTGNVISVADAGIIAQVLHGIIPILLCISLESLLRILRFNIQQSNKVLNNEQGTQIEVTENARAVANVTAVKETPEVVTVSPQKPAEAPEETIEAEITSPEVTLTEEKPAPLPVQEQTEVVATEPAEVPPAREEAKQESLLPTPVFSQAAHEPSIISETIAKPATSETTVNNDSDESKSAPATPEEPAISEDPATEPVEEPAIPEEKKPARKAPVKRAPAKKAPVKRTPAKRTVTKKTTPPVEEAVTEPEGKPAPARKTAAPLVPENVEKYKIFLEALPGDLDRAQRVKEIRKAFPEATPTDVKAALLG